MTRAATSFATLQGQLNEFQRLVFDSDFHHTTPKSGWSISEHVDHCVRVMRFALERIHEPKPTSRSKTLVGHVILAIGWIPRGRAKAPELVRGTRRSSEEISSEITELRRLAADLPSHALNNRKIRVMKHPYFGGLTASETLRFLAIHNRHHLKIIRDIVL
jgi:hypothetical protein